MNGKNEISVLKMADVIPTQDNPRHVTKDDPKVKELAESIQNSGLLYPVICRPHPNLKGKYDLRAGFRRFLAHKVLGNDTILAIVRDMDDKTALEVTIIENLQRENLSPMEEARGVKALMANGQDIKTISAEIGKSPQWIIRRAKLLDVSPKWLKAMEDPDEHISVAKLELVSRFDHQIQDSILAAYWHDDDMPSFERNLANFTRRLKSAPWKLDNAIVSPKAGACNACKKRSSCQPGLFDDELDPDKIRMNDQCLDKICWDQKVKAWVAMKETELRRVNPGLVRVATANIPHDLRDELKDVLEEYKYEKVKKSDPAAVPAVIVHGNGAGTLIWIKKQAAGEHRGTREVGTDGKVKPLSLKEKKDQLHKRRVVWVLQHLIELIDKTKTAPKLATEHYLALAAAFGATDPWECKNRWKFADALFAGDQRSVLLDHVWKGLQNPLKRSLESYAVGQVGKTHEDAAENVASILGKDYGKLLEEAKKEIPEPKSWGKDEKAKA